MFCCATTEQKPGECDNGCNCDFCVYAQKIEAQDEDDCSFDMSERYMPGSSPEATAARATARREAASRARTDYLECQACGGTAEDALIVARYAATGLPQTCQPKTRQARGLTCDPTTRFAYCEKMYYMGISPEGKRVSQPPPVRYTVPQCERGQAHVARRPGAKRWHTIGQVYWPETFTFVRQQTIGDNLYNVFRAAPDLYYAQTVNRSTATLPLDMRDVSAPNPRACENNAETPVYVQCPVLVTTHNCRGAKV